MARGIGIDLVRIGDVADHLDKAVCACNTAASSWLTHLFTSTELEMAFCPTAARRFLAGRLARQTRCAQSGRPTYQWRIRPALGRNTPSHVWRPYVNVEIPALRKALDEAHVDELLVSISNDGGYAAAIVLAQ